MNFRTLLEQYKNNTICEEKKKMVEEELDKFSAISEYLEEEFQPDLTEEMPDFADEKAMQRVRRKINWRQIQLSFCVVVCVLVVLAGTSILLDRVVFYDPNEGPVEETYGGDGQFYTDMMALVEATMPGYTISMAKADKEGLGRYQMTVAFSDLCKGESERQQISLVRGNVDLWALQNMWKFPMGNAFGYYYHQFVTMEADGTESYEQDESERQYYQKGLSQLPDSTRAKLFVTFPEAISLEELAAFEQQYPDVDLLYAAVENDDHQVVGFQTDTSGMILENEYLKEQYPALEMVWLEDSGLTQAQQWEAHYLDLMTYLSQQEEFLDVFADVNGLSAQTFGRRKAEAEETGIQVIGCLVTGRAPALTALLEEEAFQSIYVDEIWLSLSTW